MSIEIKTCVKCGDEYEHTDWCRDCGLDAPYKDSEGRAYCDWCVHNADRWNKNDEKLCPRCGHEND